MPKFSNLFNLFQMVHTFMILNWKHIFDDTPANDSDNAADKAFQCKIETDASK